MRSALNECVVAIPPKADLAKACAVLRRPNALGDETPVARTALRLMAEGGPTGDSQVAGHCGARNPFDRGSVTARGWAAHQAPARPPIPAPNKSSPASAGCRQTPENSGLS